MICMIFFFQTSLNFTIYFSYHLRRNILISYINNIKIHITQNEKRNATINFEFVLFFIVLLDSLFIKAFIYKCKTFVLIGISCGCFYATIHPYENVAVQSVTDSTYLNTYICLHSYIFGNNILIMFYLSAVE